MTGCAVIISHDRWFLDRIATHILAFEGDSQVCVCDLRKFIIILQKRHLRESVSCVQAELSVLIITF